MENLTPYIKQLRRYGIRLPTVMCKIRTDEGREKRKRGIEVFAYKFLTPRADHMSNTLTGVTKDNLIMTTTNITQTMEYKEHPTKQDLLDYFGKRIGVRKMTPREALRLMSFSEESINKMMNATKAVVLKDGMVKHKPMPKTQLYKQAGNSIDCNVIYHLGRTLWCSSQPENNQPKQSQQLSLFGQI